MACLTSKVSSNMMTFNANLVLIGVLMFSRWEEWENVCIDYGMRRINMSFHGTNPNKFIMFYQTFFQNKKLLDTFFNV